MAAPNAPKVSTHVPDDLAICILSKLPLKSLKRFTCAKKSWSLLLKNPHFLKMFRKSFLSAHCSLYDDDDDTCVLLKQTVPTPWDNGLDSLLYLLDGEKFENKVILEWPRQFQLEGTPYWPPHIAGCINGVICLFDGLHENGSLWNPATQECITIPPSPLQILAWNTGLLNWNTTVFILHGFGYDSIRDDYKVIRCVSIRDYTHDPDIQVAAGLAYVPTVPGPFWEIYSLRSNSWRKLDMNVPELLGYLEVYLNGACHWLGGTHDEPCVVSFNLTSEVFVTTPLLSDSYDSGLGHLVVLNGSIAMITMYSMTASFHISILGEPGFEGSWVKLFIVGPLPFIKEPIGAGKNSQIFFRTKDDDLVCFDLNTQTFEETGLKGVFSCELAIYKKNHFPIVV